jgi:hypothetical protein
VQRSGDGGTFGSLGVVPGNGTSSLVDDYQFLDSFPLTGDNFYRLQQVDRDGHATYSAIILLNDPSGNGMRLYPNPATTILNIVPPANSVSGILQVDIFDATGQLVLSQQNTTAITVLPMNITLLKPGTYTITLYLAHSRLLGRFIKL